MGNKQHFQHVPQNHNRQGNGANAAHGSPIQQQESEQHRFEARDHARDHSAKPEAQHVAPPSPPKPSPSGERSLSSSVLAFVEDHPIPIAFTVVGLGAGITWLVMSNRTPPVSRPTHWWVRRTLERSDSEARRPERKVERLIPKGASVISASVLAVAAGVALAVFRKRADGSWFAEHRQQLTEIARSLGSAALDGFEAIAKQAMSEMR